MGFSGKSEEERSNGGSPSGPAKRTSNPAEIKGNAKHGEKRKRVEEGCNGGRTSGQAKKMSNPRESKVNDKHGGKRMRESEDIEKERPSKRSNRSEEHHKSFKKCHQELQGSICHKGLCNEGRIYTESPERAGQKRKSEEKVEEVAIKRTKRDENEAATSSAVITPLGLSQFQFHQELGRGAFGAVILASVKNQNIMVAVKAIPKSKASSLLREKTVLLKTSGNPYICMAYAGFQTDTHGFIVMEHLPGGDLEEILNAKGLMDVSTTALCTAEIISGIQHLHKLGVVHRDLKTDNILIDHRGHIRICDFGLAAGNVFGTQTMAVFCGTPYYMAPEMWENDSYGSAIDWWAFGVIIFRLLTHTFPFHGVKTEEEFVQLVTMGEPIYPKYLTAEAKDIIMKLLDKDWHTRLGGHGDVRQHPFYCKIDWQKIDDNTIEPPFMPSQVNSDVSCQTTDISFLHPPEEPTCSTIGIPEFSFIHPAWEFRAL